MQTSTIANVGARLQSLAEYWLPGSVVGAGVTIAQVLGIGNPLINAAIVFWFLDLVAGSLLALLRRKFSWGKDGVGRALQKAITYAIVLCMATYLRTTAAGIPGAELAVWFANGLVVLMTIRELRSAWFNFRDIARHFNVETSVADDIGKDIETLSRQLQRLKPTTEPGVTPIAFTTKREVIHISGAVDGTNREIIIDEARAVIGVRKMVTFELSKCALIDSEGLTVFLNAMEDLNTLDPPRDPRQFLVVQDPQIQVERLLLLTNLSKMMVLRRTAPADTPSKTPEEIS